MREESKSGAYQVPKEKSLILVKIPPFPPQWKTVFLSATAEDHQGPETTADLFNSQTRFIPLQGDRGQIDIVRRSAIRWIKVEDPKKTEWYFYETIQGAPGGTARYLFFDGEELKGTVYAPGLASEGRTLDSVNRPGSFHHLEASTGLFLVNVEHIVSISTTEE